MLASNEGATLSRQRGTHARSAVVRFGAARVVLAIPETFMNESGLAVRGLERHFRITDQGRVVIVHDELDLPAGVVRVKVGGGTAGHNGLRSIESHVGSLDFVRVRIGIGKPPRSKSGVDHVLHRPSATERTVFDDAVVRAGDAVAMIVEHGPETAMTRYNGS